ncbi:MAG: GtrA family protein [Clostridia bacterium]
MAEKLDLTSEEKEKLKKLKRKQELVRAVKYTLFAASAGVIQLILDTILVAVSMKAEWAHLIAIVVSVVWNFTFNRKYTFKSAGNVPVAMLKVAGYNAVFIPLSTWWTKILTTTCGWSPFVTELFNLIINFLTESVFYRFVVFAKSMNTSEQGKEEDEKIIENVHKKD